MTMLGARALHALAHIGENRSIAPVSDRLEARPELVERKVTVDLSVELSVVNELLAQRLAVLLPQSFAAYGAVYLKFFNKNPRYKR